MHVSASADGIPGQHLTLILSCSEPDLQGMISQKPLLRDTFMLFASCGWQTACSDTHLGKLKDALTAIPHCGEGVGGRERGVERRGEGGS